MTSLERNLIRPTINGYWSDIATCYCSNITKYIFLWGLIQRNGWKCTYYREILATNKGKFFFEAKCDSFFFFFSWHVHTRGGEEIRTSDLHFIRRGPSRLSYFLGTSVMVYSIAIKARTWKEGKPLFSQAQAEKYQRWLMNLSPIEKCFVWRNHHRKTTVELEGYRERVIKIAYGFESDRERDEQNERWFIPGSWRTKQLWQQLQLQRKV